MFSRILSFLFMLILGITSTFGIELKCYESKQLFNDDDFENGFYIVSQQAVNNSTAKIGEFTYSDNTEKPDWTIAQWNSGNCLWADRIQSDKYTITDGLTKWVTYNPDDSSVAMRLNAANVYNGAPAGDSNWPHLLLEQSPICDYSALTETEKAFYNCSADRMVVTLNIRIKDFKETTNPDGINAVQYLAYFYMSDTDGHNFIWFGLNLFDNRGYQDEYWALDPASNCMIYSVSTKDTFGSERKSLYRNGKPYVSDEWISVQLDLTPYIEKAIENANKSNTFGEKVKAEDFYISGTNIGFEIHGNYDCTVEIKDFTLTSYNKK